MSALDPKRVAELLDSLEQLAAGDLAHEAPISEAHDELDAVAFGVNVLVGELRWASDHLRRAKDEAEHANRAKTAFLRNISHDLRTPLTAIVSLAQLLGQADLDARKRLDLVARLDSNAHALIALVDDLLDLARVEASKLPFEIAPVAAAETVADVVRSLEPEAHKKGLRMTVEHAPDAPPAIASDARRVRQVLTNVIGNALKFTERGGIRIVLHRIDDLLLAIDVHDTGIGIDASHQNELFVPFQQADPSIARAYGGSGLGLVLSRRLAVALGGDLVLLASTPGVGSTFRLTLPVHTDGLPERAPEAAASPSPVRPLAGLKVLLAEDHEDIRVAIVDLLAFAGASIDEVADGDAAVERALASPFDTVLMDVRMPGMDGLRATRRLRERGYRRRIVALTADAMKEHRAECLAAGYDDYLAKPVEYQQLVDVLLRGK